MARSTNRSSSRRAEIGIFGGSGFYSFLEGMEEIRVHTPYGAPSDKVVLGTLSGKRVAFIPRHGREHTVPAHAVNFRANIWAFKELGVEQIIAPCSCGSLQNTIQPGEFVILDQFVDRTSGRRDTYFDGPVTHHIGAAEPYCDRLRRSARDTCIELGIPLHPAGTIVVIQGPRFSTRAESAWFTKMGWDLVGMTQYPEAILARELGICYVGIALVTDYDVGLAAEGHREPVSIEEVFRVFHENVGHVKKLIERLVATMPMERTCSCAAEAEKAVVG
jgi:5'-methylthioadenosine phosphorylase